MLQIKVGLRDLGHIHNILLVHAGDNIREFQQVIRIQSISESDMQVLDHRRTRAKCIVLCIRVADPHRIPDQADLPSHDIDSPIGHYCDR